MPCTLATLSYSNTEINGVKHNKAKNNVVVACRLHYINTLKQNLDGTRAYQETDNDEILVFKAHLNELPVKFSVCGQGKLPTMYWLPKLHKTI